ncbi:hypothetical protein JAAARDRAFT_35998 [Jaapia argillacea MUCL 33604]|uniref:HD/PDEase domain-containing protein n=1 Tax=Jaapia argillacea MUCL 33604 TaxID=933084 RepID=A0A067Q455_9AGAM|nr:hypothetical protein JAAARDRAFT_35998 [Jaapia argillacea MUCL 33604]
MVAPYPSPAETCIIQAAEELMRETMARYDPSHDAYHVERVRKTALHLARSISADPTSPKPDLLTVELSALLHDVLDKKYVPEAQSSDPYAFFLPFFLTWARTYGLDLVTDGRAKQIAMIIDNVSWSTEKKRREQGIWGRWHDECLELHCVQDADRLDAIGAFGIMRCAAYSATVNRPLYISDQDPAHDTSAVHHFYDKLLHIRDRLKTSPGRKLGEQRHQLMLQFLEAVKSEYQDEA